MRRITTVALAGAALAAGCGDEAASDGGANAAQPEQGKGQESRSERTKPAGQTIKASASQYGKVLFSNSGRAIYYFDKEAGSDPKCFGACAHAWPPVLTRGKPRAGRGARSSLMGTTRRGDRRQVTYDGHPLYFYVDDPRGKVAMPRRQGVRGAVAGG